MVVSNETSHHGLAGGTLASDVFHRLRDDIISCVLKPGEKLKFDIANHLRRQLQYPSRSSLKTYFRRSSGSQRSTRVPTRPRLSERPDRHYRFARHDRNGSDQFEFSAATRIGKPACSRRTIAWTANRRGMASATS